jgi:uncharacterized membrane protein YhaH (DUF805 family)
MSNTFNLRGRISREEYVRAAVSLQIGAGITSVVVVCAGTFAAPALGSSIWLTLAVVGALLLLFALFATASFALAVRRMHDLGAGGWWVALGYGVGFGGLVFLFMGEALRVSVGVPVGLVFALCSAASSLALLSVPGQGTANRFGEPPAAVTGASFAVVEATPTRDLVTELRGQCRTGRREDQTHNIG